MKITFSVDGMHCDGCKKTLENELKMYKDITEINVILAEKKVTIVCDKNIKIKELEKRIKKVGFKPIEVINIEE